MSEWLTTGQMIDRLKVGEVAELSSLYKIPEKFGPSYGYLTKNDDGDLLWCSKDRRFRDNEPLNMFGYVCRWKWRILPNYVTFEEVLKALTKGKRVKLGSEIYYVRDNRLWMESGELGGTVEELPYSADKWIIEEE